MSKKTHQQGTHSNAYKFNSSVIKPTLYSSILVIKVLKVEILTVTL